jgi:DNA-binding GntR family transcriptional regulator
LNNYQPLLLRRATALLEAYLAESKHRFASVNEQLIGALRDMILDGRLPPGAPLTEARLAEYFGVSRNTFRGAIRALAHEGLVRQDRHKTATVFEITVEDAADLYATRRVLELTALDRLDEADSADLNEFDQAYEKRADMLAQAASDWAPVITADVDFNRSIVGLHHSPRLLRAFDQIKSELVYCVAVLTTKERRAHDTNLLLHEHEELHQAVLDRDAKRARRVLSEHLDHYEREIRKALSDRSRRTQAGSEAELPPRP